MKREPGAVSIFNAYHLSRVGPYTFMDSMHLQCLPLKHTEATLCGVNYEKSTGHKAEALNSPTLRLG